MKRKSIFTDKNEEFITSKRYLFQYETCKIDRALSPGTERNEEYLISQKYFTFSNESTKYSDRNEEILLDLSTNKKFKFSVERKFKIKQHASDNSIFIVLKILFKSSKKVMPSK